MTPEQFDLAISGLKHSERSLNAVRLVLVLGRSRSQVMKRYGLTRQRIHTLVGEVVKNLDKIIEENELVYRYVLSTKPQDRTNKKNENDLVERLLKER